VGGNAGCRRESGLGVTSIAALSRTLKEEVQFTESRITSADWATYPIVTFSEVPEMEIVLLDRPDRPALGAGEPSTVTTAPAVANAVFDATGVRLRQMPFPPERVRAALLQSDRFEEFQGICLNRTFSAASKIHAKRGEWSLNILWGKLEHTLDTPFI
jgi:hypothetical protein